MAFTTILRSIVRNGSLCVIDSAGRQHTIGDGSPPEATIRLISTATEYILALNPALALGEAYMDGRLVIEEGSLYGFLDVLARNYGTIGRSQWMAFLEWLNRRPKQSNSVGRARLNAAHHYDLSPAFL
jgi:cyclopropane-fatty-acyl-phospholipid synthase